jgi:glycosyltransferase involved in cell wall biosynthesis
MLIQNQYPKTLILTYQSVSVAHGTGAALIRQLSKYPPEKLANIYLDKYGAPTIDIHFKVSGLKRKEIPLSRVIRFFLENLLRRPLKRKILEIGVPLDEITATLRAKKFVPELVYANPMSKEDIVVAKELYAQFQCKVIFYFQDYHDEAIDFNEHLSQTASFVQEYWALTPEIAKQIQDKTKRPVSIVNNQHSKIPVSYKTDYRKFSSDFDVVMVGNIWTPSVLIPLRKVWANLMAETPGLKPIQWYAHPEALRRVRKVTTEWESAIQYAGFLQGDAFLQRLQQADMTISPVNKENKAQDNIARYSLPSRMTEFSAVGIPMFFAASPDSATASYLRKTGIGVCETLADLNLFQKRLKEFVENQSEREMVGKKARQYAVDYLDIEKFQDELYRRFQEISETKEVNA